MKTQGLLLICFFSAVSAERILNRNRVIVFEVMEGEDFRKTFGIYSSVKPSRTYLKKCSDGCEEGVVLMEVNGNGTDSGRYSLRNDEGQTHVTITQVTKADAGVYRVGSSPPSLESYKNFQIIVRDLCDDDVDYERHTEYSESKGADLTIRCDLMFDPSDRKFLCRDDCSKFLIDTNDLEGASAKYRIEVVTDYFNVVIKNLSWVDSGLYRCGMTREGSSNKCEQFRVNVDDSGPALLEGGKTKEGQQTMSTGVVLPVVVGLLVGVVLILVVLLIVIWKKTQTRLFVNPSPDRSRTENQYEDLQPTYEGLRPETREEEYGAL